MYFFGVEILAMNTKQLLKLNEDASYVIMAQKKPPPIIELNFRDQPPPKIPDPILKTLFPAEISYYRAYTFP